MKKKIEIQLNATVADETDILDRYPAFKAGLVAATGATAVVTRGAQYVDWPGGDKLATFVVEIVVDRDFDFGENFEAVSEAMAKGLSASSVTILCANEADIDPA